MGSVVFRLIARKLGAFTSTLSAGSSREHVSRRGFFYLLARTSSVLPKKTLPVLGRWPFTLHTQRRGWYFSLRGETQVKNIA